MVESRLGSFRAVGGFAVGFMSKMKQFMGIGGVDIVLTVPAQVEKARGVVEGRLALTTKSDQLVQGIEVKLVEQWTTGRGEAKETEELELGTVKLPGLELKVGETRELPFTLPFELLKSENDRLKEKGGVLGALGTAGALMDGEKSTYRVTASGDVKGTAFGPTDEADIQLV
jgi:hypothetical protein